MWMKNLSYADADIYDYKNLKDEDKGKYDFLSFAKDRILNETTVDDYLETKEEFGIKTKGMIKEFLLPFIDYLRLETYKLSVDFLIETIDSYPN